jgi:hypothetical protein
MSGPGELTSRFSSSTQPLVVPVRPATMLSSVDLPQPEWPMIETYSPFSIVRLISFSTSVVALPRVKVLSMWSSFR